MGTHPIFESDFGCLTVLEMLRVVTRRLATSNRVLKNDDKSGLNDFFRPSSEWEEPSGSKKSAGLAWPPKMLGSLTVGQLHELWYILLREKNVINTEKYHHWKKGHVYNYTHDPEEIIAESMANIKDRLKWYNERAAVLNGEKDPRQEKSIRMTNVYDTEPYGQDVALEKYKKPSSWFQPENYPANPNTHYIDQYYPQAIEQPVEISFNESLDWDKIQLKEDRYMQEHYHWAKVQNLWDHYVNKQKEMLSTEEYKMRLEDGYYPKEMPEWWRRRYSHENMWKYGIWPQHSVIAKREQLSKYQKEKINMARREIIKAEVPDHVMGPSVYHNGSKRS